MEAPPNAQGQVLSEQEYESVILDDLDTLNRAVQELDEMALGLRENLSAVGQPRSSIPNVALQRYRMHLLPLEQLDRRMKAPQLREDSCEIDQPRSYIPIDALHNYRMHLVSLEQRNRRVEARLAEDRDGQDAIDARPSPSFTAFHDDAGDARRSPDCGKFGEVGEIGDDDSLSRVPIAVRDGLEGFFARRYEETGDEYYAHFPPRHPRQNISRQDNGVEESSHDQRPDRRYSPLLQRSHDISRYRIPARGLPRVPTGYHHPPPPGCTYFDGDETTGNPSSAGIELPAPTTPHHYPEMEPRFNLENARSFIPSYPFPRSSLDDPALLNSSQPSSPHTSLLFPRGHNEDGYEYINLPFQYSDSPEFWRRHLRRRPSLEAGEELDGAYPVLTKGFVTGPFFDDDIEREPEQEIRREQGVEKQGKGKEREAPEEEHRGVEREEHARIPGRLCPMCIDIREFLVSLYC